MPFPITQINFIGLIWVTIRENDYNNEHFSHVNKNCIFKNYILRRKADHKFCGNFLENHFRHLKSYSNTPNWLGKSRFHMGTFWKKKVEVYIFDRTNLSGFATWEFTTKKYLNPLKQIFLLKGTLIQIWKFANIFFFTCK